MLILPLLLLLLFTVTVVQTPRFLSWHAIDLLGQAPTKEPASHLDGWGAERTIEEQAAEAEAEDVLDTQSCRSWRYDDYRKPPPRHKRVKTVQRDTPSDQKARRTVKPDPGSSFATWTRMLWISLLHLLHILVAYAALDILVAYAALTLLRLVFKIRDLLWWRVLRRAQNFNGRRMTVFDYNVYAMEPVTGTASLGGHGSHVRPPSGDHDESSAEQFVSPSRTIVSLSPSAHSPDSAWSRNSVVADQQQAQGNEITQLVSPPSDVAASSPTVHTQVMINVTTVASGRQQVISDETLPVSPLLATTSIPENAYLPVQAQQLREEENSPTTDLDPPESLEDVASPSSVAPIWMEYVDSSSTHGSVESDQPHPHETVSSMQGTDNQLQSAPLFSLPVEIISKIMCLATESLPRPTSVEEHRSSMQYVLPQVCRGFRQVALDTPRLWTSITLPLHAECTEEWLIRSHALSVDILALLSEASDTAVTITIWLLSQSYVRDKCRRLCIRDNSGELPPFLYLPAPHLEELEIYCEGYLWWRRIAYSSDPFFDASAPRLRTLTLAGFPFQRIQDLCCNVSTLELVCSTDGCITTTSEFQSVLHGARHLRTLTIRELYFDTFSPEIPVPAVISFPSLEYVDLQNQTFLAVLPLLPSWRMEHPFELVLTGDCRHSTLGFGTSLRLPLIPSFFSNLIILRVNGATFMKYTSETRKMDHDALVSFIIQAPQLVELHLQHLKLGDSFHDQMKVQPGACPLVPHLRRYSIERCFVESREAFMAAALSRIQENGRTDLLLDAEARNCTVTSTVRNVFWPGFYGSGEEFSMRMGEAR